MDDMISKHGLKDSNEFMKGCSQFGMKLAKIDSVVKLKRLILFGVLKKLWIHDKYGILVGVDNGCPNNCSGKYYSLDGSTNITDIAAKFNEELKKSFEPVKGNSLLVFMNGGL